MSAKIVALAVAGLVMLTGGLAEAQDSLSGAVIVIAKGSCTRFTVSGQSYSCSAIIYSHFRNGRTGWQIPIPNGALMLSGGRDSQPDPTKYILQIDMLRFGRGDGSGQNYRVEGTCTASLSADGEYFYTLSCSAKGGAEDIQLEFKGDGSPVDRKVL
ncbi:hypothetical protein [Methylovirgula sp. 4M-Z18]|uniref:hypothetical protein n=1 Tax=Methylovirgula sp. 4M-Z18 TaxID=2293567 RepID=UPI000E2F5CAA|nr:hypothetical protein [Methylovirgula sp. 4M-Z18]